MGEKINQILILTSLIVLLISISGCIGANSYNVTINNGTFVNDLDDAKALQWIEPKKWMDAGYPVVDHGVKMINGVQVYYVTGTDPETNTMWGSLVFKKNGTWHAIDWEDQLNNPNKNAIESDIVNKIKSI